MKITSLRVERFGVWENLNLPKLSRGLNVFFGPNEAGKTTLMQFIRTCLYGGGDEERARYIQMSLDGRRRRERRGGRIDESDPRRASFASSLATTGESTAPDDIRRFLEAGKRGRDETSRDSVDSHSAARDRSRAWIGGVATVSSDYGDHRLERRYIRRDTGYQTALERNAGFVATDGVPNWSGRFYSLPGRKIAESLVVTGPDGARVGDYFAKSLTCNLDESTYNGVFAIGLDELQRLGMLNETEAAQMLYRLSVGVDRGAFVQVFQQIVAERNDLLDVKGGPCILTSLMKERDKARMAASESASDLREYARLLEERRAVLEATQNLQERIDKAVYQKRTRELALQSAPIWDERDVARATLDAMGDVADVPRSAIAECDAALARCAETNAKIKELKAAYRAKKDERDAIEIDPVIDELAPRVSILEEDLPRLTEIDKKVAQLRDELADLNSKLAEEEQRVRSARNGKLILTQSALDAINASIVTTQMETERRKGVAVDADGAPVKLPNKLEELGAAFKEIEDFKEPARRITRSRRRLQKREEELAQARQRLETLVAKLEQGLTSHGQKNLTEAIERTGALLSAMRRRIEIEKRVDEMTTYRKELERQNQALVANQAIVGVPLYALGAGVVVGGLLFGLALFSHRVDLVAGLLGLLAMIGCIFYKTSVERRNRMKLEDNQRRLGLLTKQMEQARQESQSIDDKFPAPTGTNATFESRMQKAKTDLAFFESLAPVEAQWREVTKLCRAKEELVGQAELGVKKSRKRWRAWLRAAFLPTTLKPSQVRELFARVEIADDLRTQISAVCSEIEYLGRERQGIVDRCESAMALLPKVEFADRSPFYVTPKLRELLGEHATALKERADILFEMNGIKKTCRRYLATLRRQMRETRRFLSGYGVRKREQLVSAVERRELYLQRVADLGVIQSRLDASIGGFCPEDEIGQFLVDADARADLPTTIANLETRLDALNAELKGKLELSGRLGQQADALAAKKGSDRARFDALACDLRIARVADLWQSRAVAGQMMEDIRRAYEKERQPETLREASRYLKRLTNGLYVNIWTPLGEDALFVDASNGETLDVAALSRGTRELLFIAIRLALVVSFEKHGVQMPLIWDDVLVNFDYKRAAAAAKLLYDFAKSGRQIFLFTCHEHICRLFLRMGVPVCVLPTSNDPKKRRFRVLAPLKKRLAIGEAELSINVANPVELGPNFIETPPLAATKRETLVAEGTDFDKIRFPLDAFEGASLDAPLGYRFARDHEDGRAANYRYSTSDDVVAVAEPTDPSELDLRPADPSEKSDKLADASFDVTPDNDWLRDGYSGRGAFRTFVPAPAQTRSELFIKNEPTSETAAPSAPEIDVETSFTAERARRRSDDETVYVGATKSIVLDGQSASLRSLEETSATLSASSSSSRASFDVAPNYMATRDEFEEPGDKLTRPTQIDGVDYVPVDESTFENSDSLDYDEWTKVFSDQDQLDSGSSEGQGAFLDYFDSPEVEVGGAADYDDEEEELADEEEESEDEEEYESDEDEYEEYDADEEYEDEEDSEDDDESDSEESEEESWDE